MNLFDDNPVTPNHPEPQNPDSSSESSAQLNPEPASPEVHASALQEGQLSGDPIHLAASVPPSWPVAPAPAKSEVPEDLRISWSWLHFIVFIVFGAFSLAAVQVVLLLYYAPVRHMRNQADIERFVLSKPQLAVGSMVIWYGLILLFLYVTLSAVQGTPFWSLLGWRKIGNREATHWPRNPWIYLGFGCVLSILVFAATAKMQAPEDVPIEELFHYKNTAMLFMAMAVLVAPLVEETVFRGYLYPLFAKSFGVAASIIVTGVLFGLMHGAQLGWTWGLVLVLIAVGVVFTFVRARTGSVFASFLLHLGYNSTIAVSTILATQGFTKLPPH
jgi:membrane protease YdiL (CAAX protease family)